MQDIGQGGDTNQNLMFAGDAVYNFKRDPFQSNEFMPTAEQLMERIRIGN